jgi:hypothetical protein
MEGTGNDPYHLLRRTGFAILEETALEEKLFASSLRIVARRSTPDHSTLEADPNDVPSIQALFAQRLARWKLDLFRYRLQRRLLHASPISAWRRHSFQRQLQRLTTPEFPAKGTA